MREGCSNEWKEVYIKKLLKREENVWLDTYRMEREKYDKNGWDIEILEQLREKEQRSRYYKYRRRYIQRQWKENRILVAKYNKIY